MARPHIEPYVDQDAGFKKFTLPGFKPGMHYKMLSLDTDCGACTMTVQYDAGYSQPPGFSWSDREILVMEGALQLGDQNCTHGYYLYVPAGVALPEMRAADGALVLLMYNNGEPSFVESTEDHPQADRGLYSEVDSYKDLAWAVSTIRPSVASGCLLKILHYHPRSEALSFLYCMTPDFRQDNISYHDCAEESYHLWGTSWMMQFGELPTGAYFWRPPYINHGAFASQHGCLAFGRTTSQLYNHFHYNPWSEPEDNHKRSIARLAHRNPNMYKWVLSHGHNHPHGPEDFEHPEGPQHAHPPDMHEH